MGRVERLLMVATMVGIVGAVVGIVCIMLI
jgi:hypothetical protein